MLKLWSDIWCNRPTLVPFYTNWIFLCHVTRLVLYGFSYDLSSILMEFVGQCWKHSLDFVSERVPGFLFPLTVSYNLYLHDLCLHVSHYRVGPHAFCQEQLSAGVQVCDGVSHWWDYPMFRYWDGFSRQCCDVIIESNHWKNIHRFPCAYKTLLVQKYWGGSPWAWELLRYMWCSTLLSWTR